MEERVLMISAARKQRREGMSHRGNVTPASPGRVDGPAACAARLGPDGVRGVGDFCDPAKIYDIPGLPTGDIPSWHRFRPAGKRATLLPADGQRTENGDGTLQNPPYWGSVCIQVGRIL